MKKPELLLPAGNVENFHAAIEGGADAIYLGMKKFNARGRAVNFTTQQLQLLLKKAELKKIKIYITLNTIIKNSELQELLHYLFLLSQLPISAIIIQDWGTYYLIKHNFPNLHTHASTQMSNHNSPGALFSKEKGFKRIVMARELTLMELETINKKSDIDLEIFVHGALCYSISGMCLFSSYLGGMGANRGQCAQPCRRLYSDGAGSRYAFSLKDNQLVEQIEKLKKIGVKALKIEGRMKSAEYTYQVAQAYRHAIDTGSTDDALKKLRLDMGRTKTEYFAGNNINNAITEHPGMGLFLGKILDCGNGWFTIKTNENLAVGNRLRVRNSSGKERKALKVQKIEKTGNRVKISASGCETGKHDSVFLAGLRQKKFPSKLEGRIKHLKNRAPGKLLAKTLKSIKTGAPPKKSEIFVRINSLLWLRKLHFDSVKGVILNLTKKEWKEINLDTPFLQKNRHKLLCELPGFIPEKEIPLYKKLTKEFLNAGYKNFILSHLSQKMLTPPNGILHTNENVYLYNDAAIAMVRDEGVKHYTFPLENDFENLRLGKDRGGIVPVYFYPRLFSSRMPANIAKKGEPFSDDKNFRFKKEVRDGLTYVVPDIPVSLLQYGDELKKNGFNRFLIDLSFEKPSKHLLKKLITRLLNSKQVQPSTTFNFKKGLK